MRNLFSIICGWPPLGLGMTIIDMGSSIASIMNREALR
jgi:hypothetical protein